MMRWTGLDRIGWIAWIGLDIRYLSISRQHSACCLYIQNGSKSLIIPSIPITHCTPEKRKPQPTAACRHMCPPFIPGDVNMMPSSPTHGSTSFQGRGHFPLSTFHFPLPYFDHPYPANASPAPSFALKCVTPHTTFQPVHGLVYINKFFQLGLDARPGLDLDLNLWCCDAIFTSLSRMHIDQLLEKDGRHYLRCTPKK